MIKTFQLRLRVSDVQLRMIHHLPIYQNHVSLYIYIYMGAFKLNYKYFEVSSLFTLLIFWVIFFVYIIVIKCNVCTFNLTEIIFNAI